MRWVIYDETGTGRAAASSAEDAAMIVAMLGEGSTVRVARRIVWREGSETISAGESYDDAAYIMRDRAGRDRA